MSVRSGKRREPKLLSFGLGPAALIVEAGVFLTMALLAGIAWSPAYGRSHSQEKPKEAQFKYAGGTEDLPAGCGGRLELTGETLTFNCFQYSVAVPYSSINLMQYRPDVSKPIWKLKLKWKVRPEAGGGKRNRYFTVRYTQGGATHVIVLEVLPEAMRPYLAEIDLKAGRRVEVKGYEHYD